ncbi:hypothetical protein [Desulfolithobacter sp.]
MTETSRNPFLQARVFSCPHRRRCRQQRTWIATDNAVACGRIQAAAPA